MIIRATLELLSIDPLINGELSALFSFVASVSNFFNHQTFISIHLQVPVTLLEYSLNSVTEGIDAIATTRVVIRGENSHSSMNATTGETVRRTFRYGKFLLTFLSCLFKYQQSSVLPVELELEWILLSQVFGLM